jgi:uncharacterized protein (TIGR03067 family)
MMSLKYPVLAASLVLLLGVAAESKAQPTPDFERIAGEWILESLTVEGRPVPEEVAKKPRFNFTSSDVSRVEQGKRTDATFSLDENMRPKWIDITPKSGDKRPRQGIYTLTRGFKDMADYPQDDRLTICIGEMRPNQFTTAQGSRSGIMVLKRYVAQ